MRKSSLSVLAALVLSGCPPPPDWSGDRHRWHVTCWSGGTVVEQFTTSERVNLHSGGLYTRRWHSTADCSVNEEPAR